MKHLRIAPLFLVAFLAGCGGDGSSNNDVARFAGTYAVTYESTATDNDDSGTLDLVIASDGTITGTGTDSRYPSVATTVTTTSLIQSNGTGILNLSVPQSGGSGIGIAFQGRVTRDSDGTLRGALNQQRGDIPEAFTFTFVRQP